MWGVVVPVVSKDCGTFVLKCKQAKKKYLPSDNWRNISDFDTSTHLIAFLRTMFCVKTESWLV